jgi:FkbM family methyltransferase
MRISDLLPIVGGIRELVDVTPVPAELPGGLRLPEGLRHERHSMADAEKLELGPESLLVARLGDDLVPVLERMRPGTHALLLTTTPIADLPGSGLLTPLADAWCQVLAVDPTDEGSAVLAERLDADAADPDLHPHQRTAALRSANADVPLARDRALEERDARIAELERQAVERTEKLEKTAGQLATAKKRLATLQSSATFRAGQVLAKGAKRPATAVINVPAGLARLWRAKRSQPATPPPATPPPVTPPAPADRVVPIALPSASPGRERTGRELITLTAPANYLVPRNLAKAGLGGYEPSALACFLAAMDVAGPGAVLDIGANVGIYAAIAAAVSTRPVWAFEPAPHLVAAAERFAADNGLGYTTESLALGAENGSATFYLSDRSDTSNSLAAGFRKSSVQVDVKVETLDSYVARTGAVPAVMKVDTETTEPDVLAGGIATINEHKPWILCEVLAGRGEDRLTEVLKPLGYHWFHVTAEIPYEERSSIKGDITYTDLMWLFTPELPDERFWTAVRERTAELQGCTVARAKELQAMELQAKA